MKRRTGFVSNSSSSSFVLIFPKQPMNVEELQKLIFEDKTHVSHPYSDEVWDTSEVAGMIWQIMEKQGINNRDNACKIMNMYEFEGMFDTEVDQFIKQISDDEVYYSFEFGDGHGEIKGGMGSMLENTDFSKFKNLQENNH